LELGREELLDLARSSSMSAWWAHHADMEVAHDRMPFLPQQIPTDYKRIQINFIRRRRAPMFGCAEYVKTLLTKVWAKFGTASHLYHEGFSYCFLSFGSRVEAEAAMNGLNDATFFKLTAGKVLEQVRPFSTHY
jgi:hypothetical protein